MSGIYIWQITWTCISQSNRERERERESECERKNRILLKTVEKKKGTIILVFSILVR